jgi:hypothetical protein
MSKSANRPRFATTCPCCGNAIHWYNLLFGPGLENRLRLSCPECRAKLRMSRVLNLGTEFLAFVSNGHTGTVAAANRFTVLRLHRSKGVFPCRDF